MQLLQSLKRSGIRGKQIAEQLGIPESAVSNLYNGRRRLTHDEALKLMQWSRFTPSKKIPLIGMAGAGAWVEAIEDTRETLDLPMPQYSDIDGVFAVEVAGDSMDIVLPEGSYAIIDPQQTDLFDRQLFLLRNAEGEATIKQYRGDPARFEPLSTNSAYVPFSIGATDFKVIGRVTGSMRKF